MLVAARYVRKSEHTSLRKDAEYVVYAVARTPEGSLYFVWDEGASVYPFAYVAELFEIVDARVSRLWEPPVAGSTIESFTAWSRDEDFFEKLLEGTDDGVARKLFAEARMVMEVEFVIPSIVDGVGHILGDGWVECTACDYIWEEESSRQNEMCVCRNCQRLLALRERSTAGPTGGASGP